MKHTVSPLWSLGFQSFSHSELYLSKRRPPPQQLSLLAQKSSHKSLLWTPALQEVKVSQPIQHIQSGELSANRCACSLCWENSPAGMHAPTTLYQHFHKKLWTQWRYFLRRTIFTRKFPPTSEPDCHSNNCTAIEISWWDRRGEMQKQINASLCTKTGFVASTPTMVWETTWLQDQNFFSALGLHTFASWTCNANHKRMHVSLHLLWVVLSLLSSFPFPYSKVHTADELINTATLVRK